MLTPELFLKAVLFCTSRLLSGWKLVLGCLIRRLVSSHSSLIREVCISVVPVGGGAVAAR